MILHSETIKRNKDEKKRNGVEEKVDRLEPIKNLLIKKNVHNEVIGTNSNK